MHDHSTPEHSAIRTDLGAIFVSLDLSRSTWLMTSRSDGSRRTNRLQPWPMPPQEKK